MRRDLFFSSFHVLFARKTEDVNMIRRVQIFLPVHPAFLIPFFFFQLQFSHLLTLQSILFDVAPCKLTEALKEQTTWKRAFSLFMGFLEFSRGL